TRSSARPGWRRWCASPSPRTTSRGCVDSSSVRGRSHGPRSTGSTTVSRLPPADRLPAPGSRLPAPGSPLLVTARAVARLRPGRGVGHAVVDALEVLEGGELDDHLPA